MKTESLVQKRTQIVAFFAAIALALSMVSLAPLTAYAADATAGFITYSQDTLTTTVGDQPNLKTACGLDFQVTEPQDGEAHLDFNVVSGDAATVNKHSGLLTANSTGTVVVEVYLTHGLAPNGNKNNPCFTPSLDTMQITVTVNESGSSYGFQGEDLTIRMDAPGVDTWSGNGTIGYTNYLDPVSASGDGNYRFNYTQNFGWAPNQLGTITNYAALNADNVELYSESAGYVASLANTNVMWLEVANSNQNFNLVVNSANLSAGNYSIVFYPEYVAGNGNNELGTEIVFNFTI